MSDTENEEYRTSDAPLLDSFGSALKKLIAKGKEQGYITIEELNQALPSEKETSDQIEDIMAAISDMEISIISADETEDYEEDTGEEVRNDEEDILDEDDGVGNLDSKELMRSDDPVRMYLKEMGSVELLSRDGEIAIAKRIEAGKTVMIGGLCENPMTLKAISKWRDELVEGTMQLRNIIDLEMMYGADVEEPSEDDLVYSKKLEDWNPETGTGKIVIEAYAKGQYTITEETKASPVDIVLVLDQSGSMADDFDGKSTNNNAERRQAALKTAVTNFIDNVKDKYTSTADHRIAIVTFDSNAEVLSGWTKSLNKKVKMEGGQ